LLCELCAVVIVGVSFDRALVLFHAFIQDTQVLAQIPDSVGRSWRCSRLFATNAELSLTGT